MATALPDTVFALTCRITSRAYAVFRSYTVSSYVPSGATRFHARPAVSYNVSEYFCKLSRAYPLAIVR
jgi:hypothetical protein